MSKYPLVLFYRDDEDSYIDDFITKNIENFNCSIEISRDTNKLFNPNYHVFITFGDNEPHLENFPHRFSSRWIHTNKEFVENVERFNSAVNYNYIHNIVNVRRETSRPVFSIFTTCYNTYDKFIRVYNSVKAQKFSDWEWVILDDSESQEHFEFLKKFTKDDHRIRLFQRGTNSGNIGCVKNEAVSLCRGKYVLELDHDDEILPDCLKDAVYEFENDPDVGFVYMDFANLYEDGKPFQYQEPMCKGYGGYYWQYYKNNWIPVYITPSINNITLSTLVCCPNHPRIWRRDVLLECGNYSEYLPICDDFEILLKTLTSKYKVVKINKLAYIQYMNNDGNNFSLIRNKEINRLGPNHISPMFHDTFNFTEAVDEDNGLPLWERKTHYRKNTIVNRDFKTQKLIIGAENLKEVDKDTGTVVLDNEKNDFELMDILPPTVRFKSLIGYSEDELLNYYNLLCKNDNCETEETYKTLDIHSLKNSFEKSNNHCAVWKTPINYSTRSSIVNSCNPQKYLEIGIENGTTLRNVLCGDKSGVDPDPKIVMNTMENTKIYKYTSDVFFNEINTDHDYDVIFIDGMHQSDFVLKDFNNSMNCLKSNSIIIIDDVLPQSENEQLKIPNKHKIENGILKYDGEPWTGDVWKVLYYLLQNFNDHFSHELFEHENYRGVCKLTINKKFKIESKCLKEIEDYNYENDFKNYVNLLLQN